MLIHRFTDVYLMLKIVKANTLNLLFHVLKVVFLLHPYLNNLERHEPLLP
jgi:hypothetical protein